MSLNDDLAFLREAADAWPTPNRYTDALARVEAEIARLEGNQHHLTAEWRAKALAAEAEAARLRDGLRRRNELIAKTIYNPPGWTGPDMWWADEARALLAEDGAP